MSPISAFTCGVAVGVVATTFSAIVAGKILVRKIQATILNELDAADMAMNDSIFEEEGEATA